MHEAVPGFRSRGEHAAPGLLVVVQVEDVARGVGGQCFVVHRTVPDVCQEKVVTRSARFPRRTPRLKVSCRTSGENEERVCGLQFETI